MILIIAVTSSLLALGLSACGDSDGGAKVVATTGILASVTEHVAGDDIEVDQLIPEGADPHDFALSAVDRSELEEAKLVVANGSGLEAGIPLDDTDAEVWELADHAGGLREDDPHTWMDPTKVAAALPSLADALADVDPEHAADYRRRADDYARELEALDSDIAAEIDAIAAADRRLVTSHDALGYFADRYGLDVIAPPFGSLGAESEPSAEALQTTIDAVRSSGVPAVFAQAEDDPSVMERIADETGVEVVDDLYVESPGPAETYEMMLRHDAELIRTALADR